MSLGPRRTGSAALVFLCGFFVAASCSKGSKPPSKSPDAIVSIRSASPEASRRTETLISRIITSANDNEPDAILATLDQTTNIYGASPEQAIKAFLPTRAGDRTLQWTSAEGQLDGDSGAIRVQAQGTITLGDPATGQPYALQEKSRYLFNMVKQGNDWKVESFRPIERVLSVGEVKVPPAIVRMKVGENDFDWLTQTQPIEVSAGQILGVEIETKGEVAEAIAQGMPLISRERPRPSFEYVGTIGEEWHQVRKADLKIADSISAGEYFIEISVSLGDQTNGHFESAVLPIRVVP